ncbi:hypothetical protein [Streptomyces sp. MB09-02B]|uniref:hypothetical protein n=1 Tax=Streptomyces sp. MB09-02B TaxID=3028667 RepID=UPI0029AC5754|nr:hypothetical protein [Streptomyces sp. MB09-02B]MDX3643477.1 hypothetical protein [Streptomyces sp. MB09-02B]
MIVLWLAVGYRVPEPGSAHGVLADVYRLAHAAGLIAAGIAISVAAYILGVIATQLGLSATYAVGAALRRTRIAPITPGHHRANQGNKALNYVVVSRLAERFGHDAAFRSQLLDQLMADPPANLPNRTRAEWEHRALADRWTRHWVVRRVVDAETLADQLEADSYNIILRLRGSSEPVALEHDRLQSEGDFRIAMFSPLAAACVILAIRWNPWCLLALPFLITLIYVGVASRTEAERGVAEALAAGQVNDPSLARLDAIPIPLRAGGNTLIASDSAADTPDPGDPDDTLATPG